VRLAPRAHRARNKSQAAGGSRFAAEVAADRGNAAADARAIVALLA
jgi:hypothetical protein